MSGILQGSVEDFGTTLASLSQADDAAPGCIAARILAHPDPERVGDFAPLFDAESRGAVALSRLAPDFRAPDGAGSGPLRSRRITRSPLHVLRQGDGLELRYDATAPAVEVNGDALRGTRTIDAGELAAGLVILFGRDLALWLGWLDLLGPAPPVHALVGESTAMRRLRQQIHRVVADTDVPVLLRGETGVGKDRVAASIHALSGRAGAAYVPVNIAGIPPTLAASELFGHTLGAFPGALEERKGYFAQADGGTLFLDAIGDVSFDVQALLLRALEEGVIQPLGGTTKNVDVRLVVATDSDLEEAIARGEFQEPLLRCFAHEIRIPPLRERREDVGLLFYHLLREHLESLGHRRRLSTGDPEPEPWIPAAYVADLAMCDWPGNVRELANVALSFALENRDRPRGRVTEELRRLAGRRAFAGVSARRSP